MTAKKTKPATTPKKNPIPKLTAEALAAWLAPKVAEEGECLIWQGYAWQGQPRGHINGKTHRVRAIVFATHKGRDAKPGYRLVTTCGEGLCLRERHIAELNPSQFNDALAAAGKLSTLRRRLATSKARLAASPVTLELAREMRAQREEGLTYRQIAQKAGVHWQTVSRVCRGETWREPGDPFAGLRIMQLHAAAAA